MMFDELSELVTPILNDIHQLPFNVELSKGTLAPEKFLHYLIQDSLYLAEFSRALALTAAKLPNNLLMQRFIKFAHEALLAEQDLHLNYIKKHADAAVAYEASPACFMYINFIVKMASTAPVEIAAASLLPCFWVYREVANKIALHQLPQNPYSSWITLYAGDEFAESVQSAIACINELGLHASNTIKQHMKEAFVRSTKLEWLFWDSAYKQEKWLI